MFPKQEFSADEFAVESEVSAQPMSNEETLRGATNRAEADILPQLKHENTWR